MKLISIMSMGDRIVRIKRRLPFYYVYVLTISNPFCDKIGWLSISHQRKYKSERQAIKAAKKWLEGAKV